MIVTLPVLSVEPAAMVRVLLEVMVKSPPTAGGSGDAETIRVTSCEEGPLSEAVTLEAPPFSLMEYGLSSSVSVGGSSSSRMVNIRLEGAVTPRPVTAADTVTDLCGASILLSTAVMVTASVLRVEPAAMVRMALDEMVKSPSTAGDTGDTEIVAVTSCDEGPLR